MAMGDIMDSISLYTVSFQVAFHFLFEDSMNVYCLFYIGANMPLPRKWEHGFLRQCCILLKLLAALCHD